MLGVSTRPKSAPVLFFLSFLNTLPTNYQQMIFINLQSTLPQVIKK